MTIEHCPPAGHDQSDNSRDEGTSRRRALRLAGAAAVGAAAASALATGRAAAAGALTTDSTANTSSSPTGLQVNGTDVAYGLGITDNGLSSIPLVAQRSAVLGHAQGQAFQRGVSGYAVGDNRTGVFGYATGGLSRGVHGLATAEVSTGVKGDSSGTAGTGVHGTGTVGVAGDGSGPGSIGVDALVNEGGTTAIRARQAGSKGTGVLVEATGSDCVGVQVSATTYGAVLRGGLAALVVEAASATAPPARPTSAPINAVDSDSDGNLWHCVAAGTPGTWRKVSGPTTGGAFHPIDPVRVYDSRAASPTPGVLDSGSSRVVSVADARDGATGAVSAVDAVPAGATAVSFNITIAETVGSGFLSVAPGNAASSPSSSINWSASGQVLANGLIVKVHADRTIRVFCGGGGATHFVIDVSGYWR